MSIESEEHLLARVPFGRSRALALIGGALFGLALQIVAPQYARAGHGAAPFPCGGFGVCHCCATGINQPTCCENGCTPLTDHSDCRSGTQCWYTCSCGDYYICCDFNTLEQNNNHGHCICSQWVGTCPTC